jgi:putative CocE/NonD family hydrolase
MIKYHLVDSQKILPMIKIRFTLLLFIFCTSIYAQEDTLISHLERIAIIEQKIMMPMRDGIRLATDIYRPKTDQPVPVVFVKTPYDFNAWQDGKLNTRIYHNAYEMVSKGYAYVIQNERGRYFSEGDWDILGTPKTDGYDAFSWIGGQSWCNGNIGTYGCSSTAEWQMAVAAMDHPAHKAAVPMGFGAGVGRVGNFYEQGNWYRGGAQQMLFTVWLYGVQQDEMRPSLPEGISREDLLRLQRFYDMSTDMPDIDWKGGLKHLPVQDIIKNANGAKGIYDKMIRRKPNDPAWYEGGLYHDDMPYNIPSFWFVSWYDVSVSPNLKLYNHIRSNAPDEETADNQYLVIAPTLHCAYNRATAETIVGERNMGDARLNYDELIISWFDQWLKVDEETNVKSMPHVRYYTMGSNVWQSSESWPPENAVMTPFYLNSDGHANSLYGDGILGTNIPGKKDSPDEFFYDPFNPIPSHGGGVCCTGNAVEGGSFDQQQIEAREDILIYTTPPLDEGVEITGFIESTLYVSSDVKDTDFTVKLIDVYPDGRAYNLDETIQRARYREGYDREVFMEEGEIYRLEMSPMATSNYFEKGHRIRIEISSSNFPRFERNLNTGGNNFDETQGVIARNKIHHSRDYPSQIRLPIINKK